ncbi:MAG: NAD(P)-dependent oxidoreductase [Sphingobacteriaceae bacterium]|nr:MAG: NAD(P)-dependent oxidoreductase [Sphingobacteriaceae bacterium]
MKVAIIGSNSLLASYLVEKLLEQETNQLALFGKSDTLANSPANLGFTYFRYPEQQLDFSALLGYDIIIYCAAAGVQANVQLETSLIYEVNAFLPIRIITYLNDKGFAGKWISFGSYFEIGNNTNELAFTEAEVVASGLALPNHYCSSKRLLTKFISHKLFTLKVFHFILPTIYGAAESPARLIPYIVTALKEDRMLQLSAGTQVRQYLHCKDVASLVSLVAQEEYPADIYNIVNDAPMQIAELVRAVFSRFGKDASPFLGTLATRDESMKYLALNNSKIVDLISNWKPLIRLEEGIDEYI